MPSNTYNGSSAQVLRGAVFNFLGPATSNASAVAIGEVTTAEFAGGKRSTLDTSNFESGQWMEYLDTMADAGTFKVSYNRVSNNAGQVAINAAFAAGGVYSFSVVCPVNVKAGQITTGDTITFNGIITDDPGAFNLDFSKVSVGSMTVQITGPRTLVEGA